jgi:hypothetical protein
VFPKNGFAMAKVVENKEELPVVYGQQSVNGDGGFATREACGWLRR